ncbi:MAG: hypothetical protein F6J92_36425 [Symploca sp. SIO1A3]|nr:hypothetical protein [Symploca sp. SIO2C1]NER52037.1 hypothetical protein [Symploca sp. SIO1A3]
MYQVLGNKTLSEKTSIPNLEFGGSACLSKNCYLLRTGLQPQNADVNCSSKALTSA